MKLGTGFIVTAVIIGGLAVTSSFEKVANWDKDIRDIGPLLKQWVMYLYIQFGGWGVLAACIIVVVMLFSITATRPMANYLFSGLIKGFTLAGATALAAGIFFSIKSLVKLFFTALWRFIRFIFSSDKPQ